MRVDAPQRVDPEGLDWSDYPDWRAAQQVREVIKVAKKINNGKTPKPSVFTQAPGDDELFIVDGHHYAPAEVDLKQQPLGYVVRVPTKDGPWSTMHSEQQKNVNDEVDDFKPKRARSKGH